MTPIRKRVFLGRTIQMSEREHVYLVDDAVEVDQVDGYEVTRRRVFFNDIEAVTIHQRRQVASIIGSGLMVGLCLFILFAITINENDARVGVIVMSIITLPFVVLFLRMLLVPARIIQVFGTRTKATMRFSFRVKRAERVFQQICDRVAGPG